MTDKQIMIDGVDVCGCTCRYYAYNRHLCSIIGDDLCEEHSDCLYKQLKRKEQECEELKQGYAELTEIVSPYMDDFTGYNEELGGFDLVLCIKELMEQLDQLKETNEGLLSIQYKLADNNKQLRQTLAEIRDVAENREIFCENCSGGCDEFTCDDCGYVKIIQKIGEVEDEK